MNPPHRTNYGSLNTGNRTSHHSSYPVVNLSKEDFAMSENTVDLTKVVYIEDDPEMIELVSLILQSRGLDVIGAHGGRKGLETAKEEIPDLILLDLIMPVMDGFEAMEHLQKENIKIPIIIITAYIKDNTYRRCKELGAAGFLNKPIKMHELFNIISGILEKHTGPTTE